ncbi:hypothetical protein D1872_300990 [compost metagenome]
MGMSLSLESLAEASLAWRRSLETGPRKTILSFPYLPLTLAVPDSRSTSPTLRESSSPALSPDSAIKATARASTRSLEALRRASTSLQERAWLNPLLPRGMAGGSTGAPAQRRNLLTNTV